MKNTFAIVALLLLATAATAQKKKLVWSEEFNYTGLPDSNKWGYEHGFIRNKEKQYYTIARKENAFVHDGVLEIKAIKEAYANAFYQPGSGDWKTADSTAQYTSACIVSEGKAWWKYGRIEVRAKLPRGLGVWPAIWMMGINRPQYGWPICGEIDIMEFVGNDSSHVYGTIHYAKEDGINHSSSGGKIQVKKPYDDFHTYALEWNRNDIRIFFDDILYHTFKTGNAGVKSGNPFKRPFYLMLNLALGGTWAGTIDDSNLPQSFLVDYVRVYK
ncbi:glycoside hydrolase family 16 protein [Foetidibacter luteolus]|uniref:glycoside hydrolase family 16 protein n=1 Tax=Foetidibacter luteolus TaxID=2608880 RepID=UPI00129A8AD8|nr:glycoside hydrolase family 16 protein [Foetidibacter luteolus]